MAAPIFLIFFQSGLPVVIPVEGEPAGDDYNGRKRRKRRGLRPDPFEPWPDEDHNLPIAARELAGYPPPPMARPTSQWGVPGGASLAPMPFSGTLDAMLGRPTAPSQPRPRAYPVVMPQGPPMAPVQEDPEEALRRMLRRG